MESLYHRVLRPGKILVDHGPVTMTIEAAVGGNPLTEAAEAGARVAVSLLGELAAHLHVARQAVGQLDPGLDHAYPPVLSRMVAAVRRLGEADFTPMAAVAGSFSDLVKDAAVAAGAGRVVVNNGGDIALHLGDGSQRFRVGIISDLASGQVTHAVDILPGQGIRGIATSGLGGRSLTKGVASAVTVLAEVGSLADAAATAIANATDCQDPAIERCLAEELDPLTDIRGHLVTRRVGCLGAAAVEAALSRGLERSRRLYQQGMIKGVVLFVQGRARMWPDRLAYTLEQAGNGQAEP
ncbi:hypothetical protein SY88_16675 [Clostridiales bacterium PH28_bin88]|nr:hypothetical protein SY88_16675 [Clostridiales bacterium PH28_bin88]